MEMKDLKVNSTLQGPIIGGEEDGESKKKVHHFYFVKFWPYNDPDETPRVLKSQQLIDNLDQKLYQMDREFALLKLKWIDTHSQLGHLRQRESTILHRFVLQKRILDALQLVLDNLDSAISPHEHTGRPNHTQGFQSWISHGRNNLVMERKLMKEMGRRQHRVIGLALGNSPVAAFIMNFSWGKIETSKYTRMLEKLQQIEERKKNALADSGEKPNIFNPLSLKSAIEEQIKIVKEISVELREEEHQVKSTIKYLEKQLKPMKDKASVYRARRPETVKRKEAAQRCILKLRQTSVKMNGMYDEYVSLLSNAKELARNKDIAALRKLSHHQVEEFMREWNNPYAKTLRNNYEFGILDSLHNRQLSHEGRIRFQNDSQETLRYIENGSNIHVTQIPCEY
ncbi:hypothetical protein V6N13_080100 [Hibiscus sabdariffa]|uniref:Uncharacterized protein n=1 Tax=Hibiscus sabdariffa TaxID=183260 RepID=A0ABR2RTC3_9ROSI